MSPTMTMNLGLDTSNGLDFVRERLALVGKTNGRSGQVGVEKA